MKRKPPRPPASRSATDRRRLLDELGPEPVSVRDLSVALGMAEKEIYPHLVHLQRSMRHGSRRLDVTAPVCRKCGFVFQKRERLTPPGRCPVCRGESIAQPRFAIREGGR